MFNDILPCVVLWGVLGSSEQVFQQQWDLEHQTTRV